MFRRLILLLTFVLPVLSQNCVTPNDCYVSCSNVKPMQVNLLKNTEWIAVPWDNGKCYFHNIKTKEDQDEFPNLYIDI
tara:strand:+ start:487 stop:720 length:234 start_codon:yes stop_codon:yes gene_type:complete